MKIAFIVHYETLYGANRSLLDLIDGLSPYDVSCYVIAPQEGPITDALRARSIPVLIKPVARWITPRHLPEGNLISRAREYASWHLNAARRLYQNMRQARALAEPLTVWGVDVIYTNTSVTPLGALVARAIRRPHVWHLREFGDLHYGWVYDWGRRLSHYLIQRADVQIAVSEAIRSHYLADTNLKRTHVIYNGVASHKTFDYLRGLASATSTVGGPYTFAIIGVIHPAKGQDVAIRALALLAATVPDVRLLVVGLGDVTALEALANDLGVGQRVTFWGHTDDPYQAYLASDAVLMCSHHEGMGRVTAEAMASCRPVIGFDHAGTPELIEHNRTGLLYKGGADSLALCMKKLIENPEWARWLGQNGWHSARERFSTEQYAQHIHDVIYSIKLRKL